MNMFDFLNKSRDLTFSVFIPPPETGYTLCKGDILITKQGFGKSGSGGLTGHAAIMADDYWVLEMPGGEGWQNGLKDNNRRISKHDWFKLHKFGFDVFRNRNTSVAHDAADWAYRNYYNAVMGSEKTQHITYKLTNDIRCISPSYCSKLVIQAYLFGSGNRRVITELTSLDHFIAPTTIPGYFLKPYDVYDVKMHAQLAGIMKLFGARP